MQRTEHAREIAERFRVLIEGAGENLSAEHYDALSLLIESGIDAALVDYMEKMASTLEKLAHDIRHDSENFN